MPCSSSEFNGSMMVRPKPSGLSAARRQICDIARKLCFNEDKVSDILLAFGEAVSNAFLHGTPDPANNYIYIEWAYSDGRFIVTVKDEGPGITPHHSHQTNSSGIPTSGCGMDLMRESADETQFGFCEGTVVVLTKHLI